MVSIDEISKVEDDIKRYFRHLDEINKLKYRVRFLENEKTKIEQDIKNSSINLDVAFPVTSFGVDSIRGSGVPTSPQERALESAFNKLEKQLMRINNEIIDIKSDVRDLEYQNLDIEYVLDKLDSTALEFINLNYGKRIGYVKIADVLHLSASSISRLRLRVLSDISLYINYMKSRGNIHTHTIV